MEVTFVTWDEAESALRNIRQKVFVEEQNVPSDLEWDADDKQAIHVLGKEGNRPVACARIVKSSYLGRVAVLKDYRGHGWGGRLIRATEQYLTEKKKNRLSLMAQANSYQFYFSNGYRPESEMVWDADIPHVNMSKILNRPSPANKTYTLKEDGDIHTSELPAASSVWFQIASCQAQRQIDIQIKDLNHPVFNNANCVANISQFLRASNQRTVRILINEEIPGLSEHPLLKLHHRMSSRLLVRCIRMKVDADNIGNHILFDLSGHLKFNYKISECCFSNAIAVRRHKMKFEEYWEQSSELIEGRRLKL